MKRVRPSSLAMSEFCDRAPWLSARYCESNLATRFGSDVDRQVSYLLKMKQDSLPDEEEILPETQLVLDWLAANYPSSEWIYHIQERLVLLDPETSEELTAGTPDIICEHVERPVFVDVDWKKKGQMWAGHLPPPDENLQQLAYVVAFWLGDTKRRYDEARIVLACWDVKGVTPQESAPIAIDKLSEIVRRIRAVPSIDLEASQPEASTGDHCDDCYQRMHCDAHLVPAGALIKAGLGSDDVKLAGFEEASGPLTEDSVARSLAWLEQAKRVFKAAKAMVEIVQGNVDAYVRQNGPVEVGEMVYGPCITKGKRLGATVETLEREGLEHLIRPGKAGVKCKWWKK